MKNHMQSRKQRKKNRQRMMLAASGIVIASGVMAFCVYISSMHSKNPAAVSNTSVNAKTGGIIWQGETYVYNDHLSNYLFMGIDTRETIKDYESQMDAGQADAIYLVSLDRVEQTMNLLSIPRDTMTEIEIFNPSGKSMGMNTNHLNLQYAYGDGKTKSCQLMKTAVSKLLGNLPIEGYYSLNMDGIPKLTDIVGGVEVIIPDQSLEQVNKEFKMGSKVLLTKDNVEQFVRYRNVEESQSALVRQNRQQVFMRAYLQKVQELGSENSGIVKDTYSELQDYTVTNMGSDVFLNMLEASQGKEIQTHTLPGEGGQGTFYDEYHVDEDKMQELIMKLFYENATEES